MKYKEDKISSFNIKKLILSNINLQISNFFKMLLKYAQPPKIFRLYISIKTIFYSKLYEKNKKIEYILQGFIGYLSHSSKNPC